MTIYLQPKSKYILLLIVSIVIGPLLLIALSKNNSLKKFEYNLSGNTTFQKTNNVNDKYFNFSNYDEIVQYNYFSGYKLIFVTSIIKYFSQDKNKEAISTVNKPYPENWNKTQECRTQIKRKGAPFYLNTIVSSASNGMLISNTLIYSIKNKFYATKLDAKLASFKNSLYGDSGIAVITITIPGNLCITKDTFPDKPINELLNLIQQNYTLI